MSKTQQIFNYKVIIVSVIFLIFCYTIPVNAAQSINNSLVSEHTELQQLQAKASSVNGSWNNTFNVPRYMRLQDYRTTWNSSDPVEKTYQYLDENKQLYKLTDPKQQFKLISTHQDDIGMTHVALQQYVQSVPVYDATLIFHFRKDGSLSSVHGTPVPHLANITIQPTVTKQQAFVHAQEHFTTRQDQADLKLVNAELVVYDKAIVDEGESHPVLTWKLTVAPVNSLFSQAYFINAQDGTIIKTASTVSSAFDEETYVESDCNFTDTLTYDETGLIAAADDADASAVHSNVSDAYDYLADETKFGVETTWLHDSSFLYPIKSYTHFMTPTADPPTSTDCRDDFSANWSNDEDFMYLAQGVYGQDIVAHELTHGLIHHTVALDYLSAEPGTLNESYADIFGTLVQYYNSGSLEWEIGESLPSTRSECVQGLRDLSNPSARTGSCDGVGGGEYNHTDFYDEANGEHHNSLIPSHAFYLLAEGGTHSYSGVTVTGIGVAAAEQIYIRVIEDLYLNPNATLTDAYHATLQACLDLYDSDPTTYPLSYCDSVQQAFYAVGIASTESYLSLDISTSVESGYAPLTVDFDGADSFALNANIIDYVWDLNSTIDSDGNGSVVDDLDNTGPIASYTYVDVGTTNARLTITDDTGHSTYTSVAITVNNPIAPAFETSGGVTSTIMNFDATSSSNYTGTIIDYAWDFGDGSTGTGSTISHTYPSSGTFAVTLTLIDSNGISASLISDVHVFVSSDIVTDTTWLVDYSPYVIYGYIDVSSGATLTIEPGVIVKFVPYYSLTVAGALNATGIVTSPIIFTSYKDDDHGGDTNGTNYGTTPTAGDWRSLDFSSGSAATLEYTTIMYGGFSSSYPMVNVESDNVTVSNSTISDSTYYNMYISASPSITHTTISDATYGIYVASGSPSIQLSNFDLNQYGIYISNASPVITGNIVTNSTYGMYTTGTSALPSITDNTFVGNTYPIYLYNLNAGTVLRDNSGSSNTYNVIRLGAISGDVTLSTDNDLTYYTSYMSVAGNLIIEPGVVIKLLTGGSDSISVSGSLTAEGTVDKPIVFTSLYDDTYGDDTNNDGSITSPSAGDWPSIEFRSGSSGSLSNAILQYGGDVTYGMIKIESSSVTVADCSLSHSENNAIRVTSVSPTITDSTITDAANAGIYLYGGSPTITGNSITDSQYGIYAYNKTTPVMTDNQIYSNSLYGVYNATTTTVTAESNWWGYASGPYHAISNPTGTGDTVSSYVDFDPWLTSDPTTDTTPPSDVTFGTTRKDVWAQTVTLNWTNPTDSDFDHVQIDRTDVTAGTTTTLSSSETGTTYIDTTVAYNTTDTYTLYVIDITGNVSTGVTTASQRLRNPAPTGLVLTPGDTIITATWNASSAPAATLGGYMIYYGTTADALTNTVDVGNVTSTTLTGLTNFTRYYVAVSAYNRSGEASVQSSIRVTRPRP